MQEKALERFLTGLSDEATDRDGEMTGWWGPLKNLIKVAIYTICIYIIYTYFIIVFISSWDMIENDMVVQLNMALCLPVHM